MRYRRLGKTDIKVSVIGLGTYQFGGRWGKTFTKEEAAEMVATAKDNGVTLLDTAPCYGINHLAETLAGCAIASSRSHWIIATKFGHEKISPTQNKQAWTAAEVQQQLEASLRALGTDYIDLYQFHSGSNEVFDNDELWTMLDKQKQAGKIRHLGVSVSRKSKELREYQTRKASSVGASVIQVKYNRLERDAELEVFPECLDQDLGVVARVPLASGLLSGHYQDVASFDKSESRASKYDQPTMARMQEEIRDIMRDELPDGVSLPQYALAWCLKNPAVSCVIPGCKTPEQARINASVGDLNLVDDDHSQAWI